MTDNHLDDYARTFECLDCGVYFKKGYIFKDYIDLKYHGRIFHDYEEFTIKQRYK